jgi:uncharacterized membrane protein YfcA
MLDYILLLIGAFAAAAISGAAGFGGALLLLPMLVRVVGVEAAVPLLTIAQLIGNLSRVGFYYREIRWRPVGIFLIAAVPAAILGAMSFVVLPKAIGVRLIGFAILVFVLLRLFGLAKFAPSNRLLLAGGMTVGFLSGVVGSAGPLGAAVFLALGLPPMAFIASEATTALTMHAAKMIVFRTSLDLGADFWPLAGALGVAMILGTWASNRIIARISADPFRKLVGALLVAMALQMLIMG